ncbi:MAG: hypothetical protein ABSD74_04015 [Rhizomicrobium sp.]|jgi:hypothetical protein
MRGALIAAGALLWAIAPAFGDTTAPIHHVEAGSRSGLYIVRYDHWTPEDERGFDEIITAIGESQCHTVNSCLHGVGNPFRASDPPDVEFKSDCADLPYVLRAYYAWKRGLPFSYEQDVEPRGHTRDIRYTKNGNEVAARTDVLSYSVSGYALLATVRDMISSASYRIHPDIEDPEEPDLYSPAIDAKSIHPGTIIYDPNGHVATIYRVDPDGRVNYIDAHPDSSVTRGFYDERFVRSRPGMGAGFKNWRPIRLVGATRRADGVYIGGQVELASNDEISDYSDVQFYGTGPRPDDDGDWAKGTFVLNGVPMDYYDYVRAELAGGKLEFDPVKEVHDMVESNCNDLHYRADAVALAIAAGIQNQPEPDRLPPNIYGTDGDWETYSTPSRDARLKTAFKELRDKAERFVRMYLAGDPKLVYKGRDLVADLIATYDREAAVCKISYARSDGSVITMGYEEARLRLFKMSFDPYHCIERRWAASDPRELSTCRDGTTKQSWYAAEQNLRNQIDRTYDAEMDFTLDELRTPGPGKGAASPPDIDARAYLMSMRGARPMVQKSAQVQPAIMRP